MKINQGGTIKTESILSLINKRLRNGKFSRYLPPPVPLAHPDPIGYEKKLAWKPMHWFPGQQNLKINPNKTYLAGHPAGAGEIGLNVAPSDALDAHMSEGATQNAPAPNLER